MTLVIAGEALIDLAPRGELLLPLPGGSPYNVAVGLGRLGRSCAYLGRVSTDGFGRRLQDGLRTEGVLTDHLVTTDEPTTLAVIHLDEQARASYSFYLQGTSTIGLTAADLDGTPVLPAGAPLHVSFGAISLDDSAGSALAGLLRRGIGQRMRSVDPNIRPAVIVDMRAYAERMDALVAICDLIKVSDEDLELLHPDSPALETASRWAASGPQLVIVTRGPLGAVAIDHRGRQRSVFGVEVEVVDTIGAGDAFTSGLLAWLDGQGCLDPDVGLTDLDDDDIDAALEHAVRVAALTCTRPGSDPPTSAELAAFRH